MTTHGGDDDSTERLSKEQLRAKRLQALLGEAAVPISSSRREVHELLESSTEEEDEDEEKKPAAARRVSNKKDENKEVIELLDSDDDDDDVDVDLQQEPKLSAKKARQLSLGLDGEQKKTDKDASGERPAKKRKLPPAAESLRKTKPAKASMTTAGSSTATLASKASSGGTNSNFQVATWNVWFGPDGDGNPHPGPRMRALCRILHEQHSAACPLWFVGFQEVVDPLARYLEPAMQGAGFHFFRQPVEGHPYGCGLAVHSSLKLIEQDWIPFEQTQMSRGFLYARAQMPNSQNEILFTTTHLESWAGEGYTGAAQRPPQLQQMEAFVARQFARHKHLSVAIMTGDMNWDDERPGRSVPLDPEMSTIISRNDWKDSWLDSKHPPAAAAAAAATTKAAAKAKKTCYTYDGKLNPMLANNLRRRFDRILLRSDRCSAVSTALLGTDPIPDLTWQKHNPYKGSSRSAPTAPSDHFGYLARLRIVDD